MSKSRQISPNPPPVHRQVTHVTIDESSAGQRLDNYLLGHLKKVPRPFVYRIIRRGEVRINGGRARADRRLSTGDIVRIPPMTSADTGEHPKTGQSITVLDRVRQALIAPLYDDTDILVLDKPAGVAVHGGSGLNSGMIEQIRAFNTQIGFLELVHRLDRDSSGCLMFAKNRQTLIALHEQFREPLAHGLTKQYTVLLKRGERLFGSNAKKETTINQPLCDSRDRSQEAVSIFRPLEVYPSAILSQVQILTGRKHQIRRHASSMDMPVAGDDKYGNRRFNRELRSQGLRRLFLHAAQIIFQHPVSGTAVTVEANLPIPLLNVLDKLRTEPL